MLSKTQNFKSLLFASQIFMGFTDIIKAEVLKQRAEKMKKEFSRNNEPMVRYAVKQWFPEDVASHLISGRGHIFLGRQGNKVLLGFWNIKQNIDENQQPADECERDIIERELP